MEPRFRIVVFGSLAAVLGIFIGGFYVPSPWAPIMITAGAVGGIAWVLFFVWFAIQMNSDI